MHDNAKIGTTDSSLSKSVVSDKQRFSIVDDELVVTIDGLYGFFFYRRDT